MSRRGLERLAARAGMGLALAAMVGVALLPVYWMVLTALREKSATMVWPPRLLPDVSELSLATLLGVLTETPALRWAWMSVCVAVPGTLAIVAVSTLAGYALSRAQGGVARGMGSVILVAKMLPSTLLVVPLYVMFHRAGLLGGPLGVVLANLAFATPFATWMMKGFFDSIPPAIEEAALIDGCGPLGALWRVVLPLALPGTAAVALYAFIITWNDFLFARSFLPGGADTTLTVGATQFLSETEMEWNRVMAVSLLAALPVAGVFLWLQRHFIGGLTQGHH
ncbi:carbohydrate ABC transporter membrane protein 2 (CUT1 family) [Humitalea rosea]|uniref:Carbohydrate ABC transporter membrane protein 2 (CUT1 family) n=1 Tax=Humitalea rosea TaxID=990373 RepID=A0A2W7I439_9PROT|nr:carbohydrate ABC transporter permease [Humitalea rosea]PZW41078.1 carbohydrate ABC transporter membrane protein 2 (CUT1 family) [Humitalea rosea]